MAWLVQTKPLARYVPHVETTPSGQELFRAKSAYYERHPGFFKFATEFGNQGVLLPDELLPQAAHVTSAHKTLPDIINLAGLGVSERLKNSIEALEPGVHQFKEVPVRMKNASPAIERYFAAVLGHLSTDQVVLEQSTIAPSSGTGLAKIAVPAPGDDGKVVIDRSRTHGWHIWYSKDIYWMMTISDELKRRWNSLGVNCANFVRLAEVGAADQRP